MSDNVVYESPNLFYVYLIVFVALVILLFLVPSWVVKTSLRKNLREDKYNENDYNFVQLTKEQEYAFESIEFNWDRIKPVVKIILKDNVGRVDLTLISNEVETSNKTVKHLTFLVDKKDNNREFIVELATKHSLHSVVVNACDKKQMLSHGLYVIDSAILTLLSVIQSVLLTGITCSMVKAIEALFVYNGGDSEFFSITFNDTVIDGPTILIFLIIVVIILMFPSINEMNKNHYKNEIYGGYVND